MILATALACATSDDGETDTPPDTDTETPPPDTVDTGFQGPFVTTTSNADGTSTTVVAATSTVDWRLFSFADGEIGNVEDPASATGWDLAFRREVVRVNGGVSGSGTVDAAVLDGIGFDVLAWPPVGGYAVDLPDDDGDGDTVDETVFFTWYDYDYDVHRLHPADRRYVVRTPAGDVRMRFDTYYAADDGNSGHPTFTWSFLEPGGPLAALVPEGFEADASAGRIWLSLREQVAVLPADALQSDDWDVALELATVVLDGGVSGPAMLGAVRRAEPYEDVTEAPPGPYAQDAADDDGDGVPEYAFEGAFVDDGAGSYMPAPATWVIERPDGSHDKLAFDSYDQGGTGLPAHVRYRTTVLP